MKTHYLWLFTNASLAVTCCYLAVLTHEAWHFIPAFLNILAFGHRIHTMKLTATVR
ncbi:MAG: hypothetical protein Q7R39_10320 [Dehalococcoidia bacterium]|nr:hypothetical protein [Dehalococcoidia bacterium]